MVVGLDGFDWIGQGNAPSMLARLGPRTKFILPRGAVERLQHITVADVLHECGNAQIPGLPLRTQPEAVFDGRAPGVHRKRAHDIPYNKIMFEAFAAVFAGLDLGGKPVFIQRKPGLRQRLPGGIGKDRMAADDERIAGGLYCEFQRGARFLYMDIRNTLGEIIAKAAAAVIAAIQHQLRRIDHPRAAAGGNLALALGKAFLREVIAPADVVPKPRPGSALSQRSVGGQLSQPSEVYNSSSGTRRSLLATVQFSAAAGDACSKARASMGITTVR
jgi:hypothetical protein